MRFRGRNCRVGMLAGSILAAAFPLSAAEVPTFNKDVLPILQKHCQTCHRPGQLANISFLTWSDTRPWAKAIKAAVLSRKMPPWFANPEFGRFSNDPSLSETEKRTLVDWVDGGGPEGTAGDAPPAIRWAEGGWQMRPDRVLSLPTQRIQAKGDLDWIYVTIPSGFTRDTWIQSIEVLPENPSIVHHAAVFSVPHHAEVPYATPSTKPPAALGSIRAVYAPGSKTMNYGLHGAAALFLANSDLVLQMHYTPNGREVTETTRLGLVLAARKPAKRFITFSPKTPSMEDRAIFRIPAGAPEWKSPPIEGQFNADAELVWFMPHMHLRGKEMTFVIRDSAGTSQTLLHVSNYNPQWQIGYDLQSPIKVHRGTSLSVDALYDNSSNNPFNPDPGRDVFGGYRTSDEMMVAFFGVIVDANVNPRSLITLPGQAGFERR